MVAVAHERAGLFETNGSVRFLLGDVLEEKFDEPFDIIWSRDAFMHIPDKGRAVFRGSSSSMAKGGRLEVITDYARGKTPASPAVREVYRNDRL